MKTQYYTASSLDGYIATEDHSLEWLFPLAELESTSYPTFISEVGALAMGSSTYEWLLRHVVKLGTSNQSGWLYSQPAWVFSKRNLPVPAKADIRFVQGDVQPIHAEIKKVAGEKNIWVVGGGDLAGQFFDAGLLDELIIQIGSVTLGSGKPLFPRYVLSPTLRLSSVQQFGDGMVELRYDVNKHAQKKTQPTD
jgi:dihydrofolate reductase